MIRGRDGAVKITLKLISYSCHVCIGPIAIGCNAIRNCLTVYRRNITPEYQVQQQKFVFEAVRCPMWKLLSLYS